MAVSVAAIDWSMAITTEITRDCGPLGIATERINVGAVRVLGWKVETEGQVFHGVEPLCIFGVNVKDAQLRLYPEKDYLKPGATDGTLYYYELCDPGCFTKILRDITTIVDRNKREVIRVLDEMRAARVRHGARMREAEGGLIRGITLP